MCDPSLQCSQKTLVLTLSAKGIDFRRQILTPMVAVNFHQVNVIGCFSLISQSIINQFPWNTCKHSQNLVKFGWLFQKLDHLTCSGISRIKLNEINGFIEERHNSKITTCQIYIYVFIHLHIEVHVLYMVYSEDNANTILHSIITDE